MIKTLLGILITFIVCIIIGYFLPEPVSTKHFKNKLKEKEKDEELEQQLRDEAKYDSNYRKRHS